MQAACKLCGGSARVLLCARPYLTPHAQLRSMLPCAADEPSPASSCHLNMPSPLANLSSLTAGAARSGTMRGCPSWEAWRAERRRAAWSALSPSCWGNLGLDCIGLSFLSSTRPCATLSTLVVLCCPRTPQLSSHAVRSAICHLHPCHERSNSTKRLAALHSFTLPCLRPSLARPSPGESEERHECCCTGTDQCCWVDG